MQRKRGVLETHIKIKQKVNEEDLLKLGCRKIGSLHQQDLYYIPRSETLSESTELVRVRKEGEEKRIETRKIGEKEIISRSGKGRFLLRKVKKEKMASEKELKSFLKNYRLIITISKLRKTFLLGNVVINIDYIENLGQFIEIKCEKDDLGKISWILEKLGLNISDAVSLTYFQLMLLKLSPIQRVFYSIYDKIARYSFGLVSGAVTVMGMIIGTATATASTSMVILSIFLVALGEALGDSLGGFMEKKVERMSSFKKALYRAKNLGFGIFFTEASFAIWFLFLPVKLGVILSLLYGILLISFVSVEESFIKDQRLSKTLFINLTLFFITVAASYFVGFLAKAHVPQV